MDEILKLITNVGFPIAVAAYLLVRIEGKLTELTGAIADLRESIITLPGIVYRDASRQVVSNENQTIQVGSIHPA